MPYASVSTWILGAPLLVLIVLAAMLIGLTLRGQRRQRQELRRFQEQLWKGLEGMEDDLLEQNASQRRELSETMQRTSDGQISLLSSVLKCRATSSTAFWNATTPGWSPFAVPWTRACSAFPAKTAVSWKKCVRPWMKSCTARWKSA